MAGKYLTVANFQKRFATIDFLSGCLTKKFHSKKGKLKIKKIYSFFNLKKKDYLDSQKDSHNLLAQLYLLQIMERLQLLPGFLLHISFLN